MNIMSISHLFLSVLSALSMGLIAFLWLDPVKKFFINWHENEKKACLTHLEKAHIQPSSILGFLLYFSGPLLSFAIGFFVFEKHTHALLFALIFSLITKRFGRLVAKKIYERHLKLMKVQLIDTLGLVANALRSGLSLLQAFEMASNEMPGAISIEFKKIVKDTQLGETFENSLRAFKTRVPLSQIKSLVDSILILRETGGNLVETFEVLNHSLREEDRVQSKIKTMTTQGVAQAVVIICMPFGLAAALNVLSPNYLTPLFEHWIGWCIIGAMFFLQLLGAIVMKKMVTIRI